MANTMEKAGKKLDNFGEKVKDKAGQATRKVTGKIRDGAEKMDEKASKK